MSAKLAAYILQLDFSTEDHQRYLQLSHKAQEGSLNAGEEVELNELIMANDVLAILQLKAKSVMKHRSPAA
jgi:hypothetical protein